MQGLFFVRSAGDHLSFVYTFPSTASHENTANTAKHTTTVFITAERDTPDTRSEKKRHILSLSPSITPTDTVSSTRNKVNSNTSETSAKTNAVTAAIIPIRCILRARAISFSCSIRTMSRAVNECDVPIPDRALRIIWSNFPFTFSITIILLASSPHLFRASPSTPVPCAPAPGRESSLHWPRSWHKYRKFPRQNFH